jgi:hypothetical protein
MAHFHCGFTNFNSLLSVKYEEINLSGSNLGLKKARRGNWADTRYSLIPFLKKICGAQKSFSPLQKRDSRTIKPIIFSKHHQRPETIILTVSYAVYYPFELNCDNWFCN